MSIVISVIEWNKKFYIASDKRGRKKESGVVKDTYKKIYKLTEDLYFGMTGIYEAGLAVLSFIREHNLSDEDILNDQINKAFETCFRERIPEKLAVIIGGRSKKGEFFIWHRTIQDESTLKKGSDNTIDVTLSSNERSETFTAYLTRQLKSGLDAKDAIIKTIEHASEIDSSISKGHDLYEI